MKTVIFRIQSMMSAYAPAATSSSITPHPPWIFSSTLRHPKSLNMSITRKSAKPIAAVMAVIHMLSPIGAISRGIQVPTYSSMLTVRGSSPQYRSITCDVHAPSIVTVTIRVAVTRVSVSPAPSHQYSRYHMASAISAPMVPGPHGKKPVPSPVENMTCPHGASPRGWLLLLLMLFQGSAPPRDLFVAGR